MPPLMAADDIAYFAQAIPTLFFWVGITPPIRISAAPRRTIRRCGRWTRQECCMGCGACCIWSLTTLVAGEVENKSSSECLGAVDIRLRSSGK